MDKDDEEKENQESFGQDNKNEEIQNTAIVKRGNKKKVFIIIGIVAVLIIVAVIFVSMDFSKAINFSKNISEQDSKLLGREANASSMTSKLSYNDFITETNMIMDKRNELINQFKNQKVIIFKNKLNDLKNSLSTENQNVKTEQIARLKKELADTEKKDNIAFGDFFNISEANLSWQEAFDKLSANISDRDKIINDLKNMDLLSYTSQVSGYIDLLNSENTLVRSYSQLLHALFSLHVDLDSYFTDYSDILADKKAIVNDFTDLKTNYQALLDKDKTFWLGVKDLMPSRDLQKALSDFYNSTYDLIKPILNA